MSFWDGTHWVSQTPPPVTRSSSRTRRLAAATLEASLVTALTFGLIAGTAFAARGGNGGKPGGGGSGGTIALAPLVYDGNGNGLPNHGDTVEFTISTMVTTPSVNLVCTQDGSVVLNGWKAYYDGSLNSNRYFGLASGAWQGGDAECTAWLKKPTRKGWSTLASTSFHVDG